MSPHYAYIVISPSPYNGNYISTGEGVSVVDNNDNEDVKLDNTKVHYVKIGHQQKIQERFAAYNTHNPSSEYIMFPNPEDWPDLNVRAVWFRHIEIQAPAKPGEQSKILEEEGVQANKNHTVKSATFMQRLALEGNFERAYHAREWFVVPGKLDGLQGLCRALDRDEAIKEKKIWKKDDEFWGLVNVFPSEEVCIEFLNEHTNNLFK